MHHLGTEDAQINTTKKHKECSRWLFLFLLLIIWQVMVTYALNPSTQET